MVINDIGREKALQLSCEALRECIPTLQRALILAPISSRTSASSKRKKDEIEKAMKSLHDFDWAMEGPTKYESGGSEL